MEIGIGKLKQKLEMEIRKWSLFQLYNVLLFISRYYVVAMTNHKSFRQVIIMMSSMFAHDKNRSAK